MRVIKLIILTVLVSLAASSNLQAKNNRASKSIASLNDPSREAQISPPVDKEICFSPSGDCDVKLWKFIQSAQSSLNIAVYDLTHEKIAHEIAVMSKKIPVRLIVDRRQAKGEHSLVKMLVKAGVNIRYGYQRGLMHNKFTIVDLKKLETGSFNYTHGATERNNENQIYLEDPRVVKRYMDRFEELWAEATSTTKDISHKNKNNPTDIGF